MTEELEYGKKYGIKIKDKMREVIYLGRSVSYRRKEPIIKHLIGYLGDKRAHLHYFLGGGYSLEGNLIKADPVEKTITKLEEEYLKIILKKKRL